MHSMNNENNSANDYGREGDHDPLVMANYGHNFDHGQAMKPIMENEDFQFTFDHGYDNYHGPALDTYEDKDFYFASDHRREDTIT